MWLQKPYNTVVVRKGASTQASPGDVLWFVPNAKSLKYTICIEHNKPILPQKRAHHEDELLQPGAPKILKLAPAQAASSSKPQCKYGKSCYRENPEHLANFAHDLDVTDSPVSSPVKHSDVVVQDMPTTIGDNLFEGKQIVLTGALSSFVRRELIARLQVLGAKIGTGVSRNTGLG